MKKFLVLFMALICTQTTFAEGAANIKIKIQGATNDNRYFLCLSDVGCLSIRAATRGKVYPVFRPVQMSNIYITDVSNNFRVTSQGLPRSCNVTVQTNQTITISGRIAKGSNNTAMLKQLHCSIS